MTTVRVARHEEMMITLLLVDDEPLVPSWSSRPMMWPRSLHLRREWWDARRWTPQPMLWSNWPEMVCSAAIRSKVSCAISMI